MSRSCEAGRTASCQRHPPRETPSLLRLRAWPLLLASRHHDESALSLRWQRNARVGNRSSHQRFHVWVCQPAGRFHRDEANRLSRSLEEPLRIGQLGPMTEVQEYAVRPCGDRHDAFDSPLRRRIGDDDETLVVVRQLVGGGESFSQRSPDRSSELLDLRIKPADQATKPELGCHFDCSLGANRGATTSRVCALGTTGTISKVTPIPRQFRTHSWSRRRSSHSMSWKQRLKFGSIQLSMYLSPSGMERP